MMTMIRQEFEAMGTHCSVVVSAPVWETARARRVLDAAMAEVAAQERALSRFDRESDLSALNGASGHWYDAGERLFSAVAAAAKAREATGGRFDPTVLPAVVAAGYDRSYRDLSPHLALPVDGWRPGASIMLDHESQRIRLEPGASIDLGGIGKGLSATRALNAMRTVWPGVPGALSDLGGDIAVTGVAPDRGPWRIDIADPRDHALRLGTLALASGGVATSGRDRRRLGVDGSGHHLIDPRTGRPAGPGPLSVTLVAPAAGQAEAHATALAVTPVEHVAAYLSERPWLSAIVVPADRLPFTAGHPPLVSWTPGGGEVAA
jgi:FAD:protein FMN transferase